MKMYLALCAGAALLATGCDNTATEPKPKIYKEEIQALDKAKNVQNIVDQQAQEQRQRLDAAEKDQ
ncbi:MAG: hypothetical protein ABIR48_06725 [Gammaproteobacteria bacterium]